jgi:diacylglycerol kinase (ATP)
MDPRLATNVRDRAISFDRAVLLVNRFAGHARRHAVARIVERLDLADSAIREVGRDGSAREIAAQLAADRVSLVLAAGGDGTWHQMLQALAGSQTVLATVPLGTSNDLARHLDIPTDLEAWLAALPDAVSTPLDVLRLGRDLVATVGGLGLPAHVAADCLRLKQGRLRRVAQAAGGNIYSVLTTTRVLRRGPKAVDATLQCDAEAEQRMPVSALLVGTVARFGGGLELCPDDTLLPGRFAALVVTATTRAGILDTLLRLRAGRLPGRHARRYVNLQRLDFRTTALVGAFGDGEWLGPRHRVTVCVERAALHVAVPRTARCARRFLEATA